MGRLLQSRLHGVAAFDGPSVVVASVVLFSAATIASLVPSWRAAKVDPNQALRYE
jgi:ABC-type antimicrobial peptide transport system permease subunit